MKNALQQIEDTFLLEKKLTAKELRDKLGFSQVLIHKHLKRLCAEKKIQKIGSAPKVFYIPVIQNTTKDKYNAPIIEENWLEIMPNGKFLYGSLGFEIWCKKRNFEIKAKKTEFEEMFKKKESLKENNLIDATHKISNSFQKNYLEKIWYIDFYSWEIFGKTVLGKLILYAKQNSDLILMKKIAERVEKPLLNLIEKEKFDMVGIIPHSVPRKKDFLNTTLKLLNIKPDPQKIFSKFFVEHAVAQKTLKSKQEREENAQSTLRLKIALILQWRLAGFPKKILLIDDACGSGATLNISAKKIKELSPETKIYALTFVGSLKGFDVITEI